jgi:hypothetical protein
MTANLFAWDQTAADETVSAPKIDELIDVVRERVGGEWNVIRSVMKLRKILFEAEWNGRRIIGKVSKSDRAKTAYESFQIVWKCGLRPPARHTVVEPIAWIPERSLLILEKAPGISFYRRSKVARKLNRLLVTPQGGSRRCGSAAPQVRRSCLILPQRQSARAHYLKRWEPLGQMI